MISFLSSPETRELVVPVSRDRYQEAGRLGLIGTNAELIQGLVIRKRPKSPFHILLVRRLIEVFEKVLLLHKGEFFVSKEDPIGTLDSEPEPDIAIIAGQPGDYISQLPVSAELVVEVAVSTLKRDQLKAEIYAVAGVKEYWIVDATSRQLERYIYPNIEHGRYGKREVFSGSQTWVSSSFPEITIKPDDLFKGGCET